MFTHFYSDPHFGHKSIIDLAKRPFRDTGEMERELVARYNAVVDHHDTVLWLGDCFWDLDDAPRIMKLLNGRKALVKGNHDKGHARMVPVGFDFVTDRLHLQLGGRDVIACHFPPSGGLVRPWDSKYEHLAPKPGPGQFVMHGHTHEKRQLTDNRIHVGVDAWCYFPASVEEVEKLLRGAHE